MPIKFFPIKYILRTVTLKCAHCDHTEDREGGFPEKWTLMRYPDYGLYWPCPVCESFMYPEGFQADIDPMYNSEPFRFFSRCPNAEACDLAQNYVPACEKLVLTPRCLRPLYEYIENIDDRIVEIEDSLWQKK